MSTGPPNTRMQRTRSSASPPHSPLMRNPLGRLWLLLALIAEFAVAGAPPTPVADCQLGPITVSYFDTGSGDFSTDLSDHGWNQLDLILLAKVPIASQPGSTLGPMVVEVTVTKGKKLFLKQKTSVGVGAEASKRFVVPVWITGPFCEDLSIAATVFGKRSGPIAHETIHFRCGE